MHQLDLTDLRGGLHDAGDFGDDRLAGLLQIGAAAVEVHDVGFRIGRGWAGLFNQLDVGQEIGLRFVDFSRFPALFQFFNPHVVRDLGLGGGFRSAQTGALPERVQQASSGLIGIGIGDGDGARGVVDLVQIPAIRQFGVNDHALGREQSLAREHFEITQIALFLLVGGEFQVTLGQRSGKRRANRVLGLGCVINQRVAPFTGAHRVTDELHVTATRQDQTPERDGDEFSFCHIFSSFSGSLDPVQTLTGCPAERSGLRLSLMLEPLTLRSRGPTTLNRTTSPVISRPEVPL
ncbi:hypothetical protein WCLP8_2380002 [uncultured Gammaproteobacteria bacterium]